ncbi:hypothetical protein [Thermococcus sp. AM4]|uniref:hypothetical protein n=1 Tax=Thermococcus sp. (strain AM4) TaxID=246969 RepID=UPI00018711AB|nr:hypothetical protein [Thermococcus sp. AM4]EEB74259.1 hypothetical protein TAM4_1626 [Thermococcus sp. AM4]
MNRTLASFLFVLLVYLSIIAAIMLLPPSDEGSSPIEELLQIGLLIAVPALASFLFLRRTREPPAEFGLTSVLTVMLVSVVLYLVLTRNCTPTTCDDGVVWFFVSGIILLGLLLGALLYRLSMKSGSGASPPA